MLAGQVAMIISPIALSQMSKVGLAAPFYLSSGIGVIVVVCMIWLTVLPGGKRLGRATREEIEKETKEMVKEKEKGNGNLSKGVEIELQPVQSHFVVCSDDNLYVYRIIGRG